MRSINTARGSDVTPDSERTDSALKRNEIKKPNPGIEVDGCYAAAPHAETLGVNSEMHAF